MKKIYTLILSALLVGCSDELDKIGSTTEGAVELTGINATIETSTAGTRTANDPVYLPEHISRFRFENGDRMTFTTIKRTDHALADFNYVGVEFQSNASGAWDRDKNTGYLDGKSTSEHPQRVYWSDALSRHTFIGFSLPKVEGFDWVKEGSDNYYVGSIGDKNKKKDEEPTIDYNPGTPETDIIKEKKDDGSTIDKEIKKSSKMRAEDLLLSYATDLVADASVANVKFYHALSSIKVQVSMSAFYGSALDGYTIVEDMKLLNQPTLYKWTIGSAKAEPFDATSHINNNPKDMMLWDYYPQGNGSGANKTFTFYGITVPQEAGKYELQDMVLTFKVKYPDPKKTKVEDIKAAMAAGQEWTHWVEKPFKATISKTTPVYFHPGQCTIINLRLNHMDEELTVGAEYMDWQFKSTPDEGDLHKNTTFLESTARETVKTTQNNVTKDDATWLYFVSENGQITDELCDIYGHKGKNPQDAFTISTAEQLLAFAYEVKEGRSFEGMYVKLDADITMQPTKDVSADMRQTWIGVGDDTHPFKGFFLGSDRYINDLYGKSFFHTVGSEAVIDKLNFDNVIEVFECGIIAHKNEGVICACKVDGNVISNSSEPVGSLVGTNSGLIFACYHIGDLTANSASVVGGLVGANAGSGKIVASYNMGKITASGTKYGVLGNGADESVYGCFYDHTKAYTVSDVAPSSSLSSSYPSAPKSTVDMIRNSFVGEKDATIQNYTADDLEEINVYNASLPGAVKVGDALEYSEDQLRNLTNVEISKDMFDFFNHFGVGFWYEEYTSTLPEFKPDFEHLSNEDINTLLTALKKRCKHNTISANAFNAKLPGAKKEGDIKDPSLNAIINAWTTEYQDDIEGWKTHFVNHYYVAQPANYPYVY